MNQTRTNLVPETLSVVGGIAASALFFSSLTDFPVADTKWLAVGLGGALLLAVYAVRGRTDTRRRPPWGLWLGPALIALGMVASVPLSRQPVVAVQFLPSVLLPVAWGMMVLTIRWGPRELEILRGALVALASLLAAIAVVQAYFPRFVHPFIPLGPPGAVGRSRVIATIGNPEYLAGFLAPVGVLALSWLWRPARWGARVWPLIAAAVILWALTLTEGRAAWGALLVGAAMLWFLRQRASKTSAHSPHGARPHGSATPGRGEGRERRFLARRALATGAAACAAALLIVAAAPRGFVGRIGELADPRSRSVQQRVLLYTVAARMIATSPVLGRGPRGFGYGFQDELLAMRTAETSDALDVLAWRLGHIVPNHVHCDLLQFWVEYGFLGLVGFVWMAVASVAFLLAATRHTRNVPDNPSSPRDLLAGFGAAWMSGLVCSLFSFPFQASDRVLLYWTLYGLTGAAALAAFDPEQHSRNQNESGRK